MAPQGIFSFQQNRGRWVVKTRSCWWFDSYRQSRVLHSFPEHRLVNPDKEEIRELFQTVPAALALRFPTPIDGCGKPSFIWVRRKPYDLTVLSANSRSKVRRGLNRCDVRRISWDELISQAWPAHMDTTRRHGQQHGDSFGFDLGYRQCPAYTPWGAFTEGRLAAFMVALCVEDWVHIIINRSCSADLSSYPNNALTHVVVEHYLSRPDVSAISHGWEPLASRESLGDFKQSMGFVKESARQRVVLRPWLRLFLNRPLAALLVAILTAMRSRRYDIQQLVGFCNLLKES